MRILFSSQRLVLSAQQLGAHFPAFPGGARPPEGLGYQGFQEDQRAESDGVPPPELGQLSWDRLENMLENSGKLMVVFRKIQLCFFHRTWWTWRGMGYPPGIKWTAKRVPFQLCTLYIRIHILLYPTTILLTLWILWWFDIAVQNGHRNSQFSQQKLWLSVVT